MRKIRVLRVLNRFNLGGPTFNVANLTKYLPEEFETKLIGGRAEPNEVDSLHILDQKQVPYTIVESMQREISLKRDWQAIQDVRKIIREYQPDIIHTHASKAGLVGRVAAILEGVPIIVHTYHGHVFHSYFGKVKTFVLKTIEQYLGRKSTAIVAISELQKHELTEVFQVVKRNKTQVIPLGFDFEKFQNVPETDIQEYKKACGIQEKDFVFCIVGRIEPIKQHELMISSFKLVQEEFPNSKLLIVGGGSLKKEMEQLCRKLGLKTTQKHARNSQEAHVIFTDWEPNAALAVHVSDCVCLSSKNEGTPVSIIESLATGVPVISTNVGGVADIVSEGENGILVEKQEPEDYAVAMKKLLSQSEQYRKNAIFTAEEIRNRYGFMQLCNNMSKLYRILLDPTYENL